MCGFFFPTPEERLAVARVNQPEQKAFIKWDPAKQTEAVTVQPAFEGNAVDFGMVIPTPAQPKLDEMPRDFFNDLQIYTLLSPAPKPLVFSPQPTMLAAVPPCLPGGTAGSPAPQSIQILESGVVGSLDYKIISATDAQDLFAWLDQNKYSYDGDKAALQYYISKNWFFTVMKIDPKQMRRSATGGYSGEVTPTRFTFESSSCVYPLRITQNSVKDKTQALFYVLAPREMDLPAQWSWTKPHQDFVSRSWQIPPRNANPQSSHSLTSNGSPASRVKSSAGPSCLAWSKKLTTEDIAILESPKNNYSKIGTGYLPPGSHILSVKEFRTEYFNLLKQTNRSTKSDSSFSWMSDRNGVVVRYATSAASGRLLDRYAWYENRTLPDDTLNGLTRLKGHLQPDQWLTKFSKSFNRSELASDMTLVEVPTTSEAVFTRMLPVSPQALVLEHQRQLSLLDAESQIRLERSQARKSEHEVRPDTTPEIWKGSSCNGDELAPLYLQALVDDIVSKSDPKKRSEIDKLVLNVVMKKDGKAESVTVATSSGNTETDKEVVNLIEWSQFTPLPTWYGGTVMNFTVKFDKATH